MENYSGMAIVNNYIPSIYEQVNENAFTDKAKEIGNKIKDKAKDKIGGVYYDYYRAKGARDREVESAVKFIDWLKNYLKSPILPGDEQRYPDGILGEIKREYRGDENASPIRFSVDDAYGSKIKKIHIKFYGFSASITPTDLVLAQPDFQNVEDSINDFFDFESEIISKKPISDKIKTINNNTNTFILYDSKYADNKDMEWSSSAKGTFGVFALVSIILENIAFFFADKDIEDVPTARQLISGKEIEFNNGGKLFKIKNRGILYDSDDNYVKDLFDDSKKRMVKFIEDYKAAWNKFIKPAVEKTNKVYSKYNKYHKETPKDVQIDRINDENPNAYSWGYDRSDKEYYNRGLEKTDESMKYGVDMMLSQRIPEFDMFEAFSNSYVKDEYDNDTSLGKSFFKERTHRDAYGNLPTRDFLTASDDDIETSFELKPGDTMFTIAKEHNCEPYQVAIYKNKVYILKKEATSGYKYLTNGDVTKNLEKWVGEKIKDDSISTIDDSFREQLGFNPDDKLKKLCDTEQFYSFVDKNKDRAIGNLKTFFMDKNISKDSKERFRSRKFEFYPKDDEEFNTVDANKQIFPYRNQSSKPGSMYDSPNIDRKDRIYVDNRARFADFNKRYLDQFKKNK